MKNKRVLITNCHTRIGHCVTRSLVSAGYEVVAGAQYSPSMCMGMSSVVRNFTYSDPFSDPELFCATLIEQAFQSQTQIILPVHEEIFAVAMYKKMFDEAGLIVCCPSLESLISLHDKGNVSKHAEKVGVPVPKTWMPFRFQDLGDIEPDEDRPVIVKPRWSSGATGVRVYRSAVDWQKLRKEWKNSPPNGQFIVQEYVPGKGAGVGVLVMGGKPIAVGGHMRLREVPISGGVSTARKTLTDPQLLNAARAVVSSSGFDNGVCMVEFRVDVESGKYWILEFNPRYWGGLSTAVASGVNFPHLHVEAILGQSINSITPQELKLIESRWMMGEVRAFFEFARAKRLPDIKQIFYRIPGHHLELDDFGSGLILAFLAQGLGYIRSLIRHGNLGSHSAQKIRFFRELELEGRPTSLVNN